MSMKVAIAGYGIEGKASYDYWHALGADVTIVDENDKQPSDLPSGSEGIFQAGAFSRLDGFDLVIRTAGLSPKKIQTDGKVWSATNEFFAKCPAPIIGVTGTKGKGTTVSLIAGILKAAGKTVHVVGNIGVPALSELSSISSEDIVVYELSSFQLWDLEASPSVAVVLMIETDHLDVHDGMDDYISAKTNIARHQGEGDVTIYHPTNQLSAQIASATAGSAVRYAVPEDGQVYIKENTFIVQNQAVCPTEAVRLPGAHNLENACAAISAALHFTNDYAAVERGLQSFSGLPHRLKRVRELRGVTYYDDSIATTPGSAIAAIRSFPEPKLLILGGKDKGADYDELIQECASTDTRVLAVGANGGIIIQLCQKYGVVATDATDTDMKGIVAQAQTLASEGSVVILSPAASSFDMFKSYADRGEKFVSAVESLS